MRCRWGWLKKQFCNYGCRMTLPRQAIIEVLSESKGHLTAEDIYFLVHKKYPSVGLTTVYRTLELLKRLGVINKIKSPDDNQARYELIKTSEEQLQHHHHVVCVKCGKVVDYKDFGDEEVKIFENLQRTISEKYNFDIKTHQVYFYGLCKACKK